MTNTPKVSGDYWRGGPNTTNPLAKLGGGELEEMGWKVSRFQEADRQMVEVSSSKRGVLVLVVTGGDVPISDSEKAAREAAWRVIGNPWNRARR